MNDLEDRIRETLRDPARALPAWPDPMPLVRQEVRRQRARLILATGGTLAGMAAAAVLVTFVMLPGAAGRAPVTPQASRPVSPAVTARVPSSCQAMPRALIKADMGIRRFVYTDTHRWLVPVAGLPLGGLPHHWPGFTCEFDGARNQHVLIGVGTRSAEGLAADRKAEHWSTAVSHPVYGLGAPAFTVGRPNTYDSGIVARRADGLVIELRATLTLQQDEAIVRRLLATP